MIDVRGVVSLPTRTRPFRILRASENQLSGSIPSVLTGLTNLVDLQLAYNQLNGA